MASHSDDDAEDLLAAWHARKEAEKLFAVLRDPMRQAARQGIRRILRRTPDEADVNDVLFKAFKEVLEDNAGEVRRSPLGFAKVVAYRRGMDRARSIIREREQIKNQAWELDQRRVTAADTLAAVERERLLRYAEDCMDRLTAEQRDVIEATVQRQESLSDWVAVRGTSYEAGRRLRARGIAALRRCIEAKCADDRRRSSDA
jgi:DNA-directed RNA polymerase specialized sigma24 family protein